MTSTPSVLRRLHGPASAPSRFTSANPQIGAADLAESHDRDKSQVTRNADGKWTLMVHKHRMRDSTLGHVITKLLTAYLPGSK
jgi:hypothetical protein